MFGKKKQPQPNTNPQDLHLQIQQQQHMQMHQQMQQQQLATEQINAQANTAAPQPVQMQMPIMPHQAPQPPQTATPSPQQPLVPNIPIAAGNVAVAPNQQPMDPASMAQPTAPVPPAPQTSAPAAPPILGTMAQAVIQAPMLFISQKLEAVEALVGFETANKYQVMDANKNFLGMVLEQGNGIGGAIVRQVLKTHRPLTINVLEQNNQPLFMIKRPFYFLFSTLTVMTPQGQVIGIVKKRFGIVTKKYDLIDGNGRVFGHISSKIWQLWTFPIIDVNKNKIGVISKKWSGALKEMFTDADTFQIDFGDAPWSPGQRATLLGAALSIDMDYFEQKN